MLSVPTMVREMNVGVQDIVVELPRVYPRERAKADPNDLVTLAFRAGTKVGIWKAPDTRIHIVRPADWKGQTPKAVMNKRVLARLEVDEVVALGAENDHNVLDAIGIGLFHLGRL